MPAPQLELTIPNDQEASGRSFGDRELEFLRDVLDSGVLTSTKGTYVKRFEQEFAAAVGAAKAIACSSGTAAIHIAIAALNLEPGSEVIVSPITDMGALTPVLYQGAIPVFADVDPVTGNMTAESIAAVTSAKTRAVLVTHLFGQPCDMAAIKNFTDQKGLFLVEDCAQAILAEHAGQRVGGFGDIGCYSLQQGKHITCGEGGIVTTEDPELAKRLRLFVNKAWGYGDAKPDHYFSALNYRLSELQGAVALAQLERLEENVSIREQNAAELSARLDEITGISGPRIAAGDRHVFWRFCLTVDPQVLGEAAEVAGRIRGQGVACQPNYIRKPAFQCQVFREQRTLGQSRYPFNLADPSAVDYAPDGFPGTFEMLDNVIVLGWNERMELAHVDQIAKGIGEALR